MYACVGIGAKCAECGGPRTLAGRDSQWWHAIRCFFPDSLHSMFPNAYGNAVSSASHFGASSDPLHNVLSGFNNSYHSQQHQEEPSSSSPNSGASSGGLYAAPPPQFAAAAFAAAAAASSSSTSSTSPFQSGSGTYNTIKWLNDSLMSVANMHAPNFRMPCYLRHWHRSFLLPQVPSK